MTRVGVLVRSLANGGAEKQALLLASALRDHYDVALLVVSQHPQHPRHLEFLESRGIEPRFLPDGRLGKLPALRNALRDPPVDVLFTFLPSDTLLGALAGRWAGVPRVYGGLRNTGLARRKVRALRLLHNHLLRATISNSRRAADHFAARGFRADKMLVVPNGIELRPSPTPREPGRCVTVLTVARFVDKKDPHTALRAVAQARRELAGATDLRYRIVGYGPLEAQITAWIGELGLGDAAEVLIDPPELGGLYQEADVYLSASRHEGLPNSILEAMNFGLPVVATEAGDTDLLVTDGETGHLVSVGDAAGLARGLVRLASEPDERQQMGMRAHRHLADGFSLDRLRADYQRIIGA